MREGKNKMMTQDKPTRAQLLARIMQIEIENRIFFTGELELSLKKSQECSCNLSGYCINSYTALCPRDLSLCDPDLNYRHRKR